MPPSTLETRVTWLDSGLYAATMSWNVENASAAAMTAASAAPPSCRWTPCSSKCSSCAEGERELAAPGLQQVQVFRGGLGRLHRGLGAGNGLREQLRHGDAERVVHAARAAGEDVDVLLLGGCDAGGSLSPPDTA
jgi:hypothetical protein